MRVAGIVVAAGRGSRLGGDFPKQYSKIAGKPALSWSVAAMAEGGIEQIIVVTHPDDEGLYRSATQGMSVQQVTGGATRSQSVRAGLDAVGDADVVLIHDAARPGLTPAMIRRLIAAIEAGADGAAPGLTASDSLRRVDAAGRVVGEIERSAVVAVQTPQAFRLASIRAAYEQTDQESFTDDIAVARVAGLSVLIVPGEARLLKLTYPEDAVTLERLMGNRVTCVGSGWDAHRFGEGDHVRLCGVRISHEKGLIGHSDADAGWHALVDAILGALGAGDIGAHFPPSDPQWKGADSEKFLSHAVALAAREDARIVHADITLICERPKIGPHREAMRARTAGVLQLPLARVSVKATTTEQMGFTGRGEGLAAMATATVERPE